MAAGLIVIGLVLATRPVGDEALRAHATASTNGNIVSARTLWLGQYLVTLSWADGSQILETRFVLPQAEPPWSQPGYLVLLFDPNHPTTVALADSTWQLNPDFRIDAVFQSVIPFTMAALALAFLVVWPTRQSRAFTSDATRRARGSLRRYMLTPVAICAPAVAVPVIIQEQPLLAYSPGAQAIGGAFNPLVIVLVLWLCVRATRFVRLRRLLTAVADATAPAAVVVSATGRKLQIDTKVAGSLSSAPVADDHRSAVRLVALKGQRAELLAPGTTVRIYGRWQQRFTALVTDGKTVIIGFGRRRVGADRIAHSLGRQYPVLRRKLRFYLVRQLGLMTVVSGTSIALIVRTRLNPGWLWLPAGADYFWLLPVLFHYGEWRSLLRRPYVARHGVVLSVAAGRGRGPITAMIEVPDIPTRRWKPIGDRQRPHWLAEGQDIVILQSPGPGSTEETAVLVTADGHAALAVGGTVKPDG